jgi:5'-methylthioadenosine phosphorylase
VASLGVIGGNATRGIDIEGAGSVALDRHGEDYTLPHAIDHEANLRRLVDAGCERVLGIASVGGLHPQYGPGVFLCPDDFIALDSTITTRVGRDAHAVVGFDADWRAEVIEAWKEVAEPPLVDGGVYWQAVGPRLETAAEIRHISRDADVIGMTIGSECVVAAELGMSYAAICAVVNYANGVGDEELSLDELRAGEETTRAQLDEVLDAVLPALA